VRRPVKPEISLTNNCSVFNDHSRTTVISTRLLMFGSLYTQNRLLCTNNNSTGAGYKHGVDCCYLHLTITFYCVSICNVT